jgi:hypothetical protein
MEGLIMSKKDVSNYKVGDKVTVLSWLDAEAAELIGKKDVWNYHIWQGVITHKYCDPKNNMVMYGLETDDEDIKLAYWLYYDRRKTEPPFKGKYDIFITPSLDGNRVNEFNVPTKADYVGMTAEGVKQQHTVYLKRRRLETKKRLEEELAAQLGTWDEALKSIEKVA